MPTPEAVAVAGALAGVLGVSLALFFQMVASKHVPPTYIAALFLVGASSLSFNSQAFDVATQTEVSLSVLAVVAVVGAEVLLAVAIVRRADGVDLSRVGDTPILRDLD